LRSQRRHTLRVQCTYVWSTPAPGLALLLLPTLIHCTSNTKVGIFVATVAAVFVACDAPFTAPFTAPSSRDDQTTSSVAASPATTITLSEARILAPCACRCFSLHLILGHRQHQPSATAIQVLIQSTIRTRTAVFGDLSVGSLCRTRGVSFETAGTMSVRRLRRCLFWLLRAERSLA
jgi:hypothetical protein